MSLIPAFAGIYQELTNANKIRLPSFCPPLRAVFCKNSVILLTLQASLASAW